MKPDLVAVLAADEITEPTPIQESCIPLLHAGRDVVGQARTGSGKTLAYALPIVAKIAQGEPAAQALVLAPTRELADQIASVFESLTRGTKLRVVRIVGGVSEVPQVRGLRAGAQVVVGTPGRVLDLIGRRALQTRALRTVVVDEADQMFDIGMAPQVEAILRSAPATRQTSLFSATIPSWVSRLTSRHLRDPESVALDTRPEDLPDIEHEIWIVPELAKVSAVQHILGRAPGSPTIVFGRTRHRVERLSRRLKQSGLRVAALQGAMTQNARSKVLAQFRNGSIDVLVATNVAARGLDIEGLARVVNYDVPDHPDLFTHRTGRTGRMGGDGHSVTLVTGADLPHLHAIERTLGRRLQRRYWEPVKAAEPRTGTGGGQAESVAPTADGAGLRVLPGERLSRQPRRRTNSAPAARSREPVRASQR